MQHRPRAFTRAAADQLLVIVTVLVVFVSAPGAIAAGFAAWRSPGWIPPAEDAVALQPR